MLECLQCNDEFNPESKELFCSMECRLKFWRTKTKGKKKGSTDEHLEDLKLVVERSRAEAKNLAWHLNRVMHDYSDWEDRIVAIEARLREVEEDIGLEEKELSNIKVPIKYPEINIDVLDELFPDE